MRIKQLVRRALVSSAVVFTLVGGAVAISASPALAAPTYCKTLSLDGDWLGFAINPHMTVPICYNGSSVWQSGNATPGVSTVGWYAGSFDWYGTYGDGGWLGAGENFNATLWANTFSKYCSPRWGINGWGDVISYSRNCQ